MPKHPSPRDAQRLVEEQVRRWDELRKERAGAPRAEPWPLVTISREFGSQGAEAGQMAAGRLGFGFWDQEILHAIAEQTGAEMALLRSLDEQSRSRIEDFITERLLGTGGSVSEYVRHVARVVRSIEQHGGAVVVGRGSQFIVDPGRSLRVRVVCPAAPRIERYAEREKLSRRDAERTVHKWDSEREAFHRRYFGRDVTDPNHYDVVVSTGEMPLEAVADIIVAAYRAKFGRLPVSV